MHRDWLYVASVSYHGALSLFQRPPHRAARAACYSRLCSQATVVEALPRRWFPPHHPDQRREAASGRWAPQALDCDSEPDSDPSTVAVRPAGCSSVAAQPSGPASPTITGVYPPGATSRRSRPESSPVAPSRASVPPQTPVQRHAHSQHLGQAHAAEGGASFSSDAVQSRVWPPVVTRRTPRAEPPRSISPSGTEGSVAPRGIA